MWLTINVFQHSGAFGWSANVAFLGHTHLLLYYIWPKLRAYVRVPLKPIQCPYLYRVSLNYRIIKSLTSSTKYFYSTRLLRINLCGFGYSPNALPEGSRSAVTPSGSSQSNLCIRAANSRWSSGFATISPRHTRLPAEKGSQLSGFDPSLPCSSRNLSGLKTSTSSHTLGSWCRAHWLITTIVSLGTSYFPENTRQKRNLAYTCKHVYSLIKVYSRCSK